MRCEESVALLPAYLERDCSSAQALELEEHLRDCCDCRGKLQQLEENRRLLSSNRLRAFTAPPPLANEVMERVHLEKRLRERRARLFNQGVLIGLLALTNLLLVSLLVRRTGDR
jgi:predicted anti-sigma-YlaC factor YlaD